MHARHEGERTRVVSGLHPNAKKHLDQVYKQIWKDVRKKRVLVVRKGNPLLQDTVSSPFEAVDKMLPDRTIAPDKRVVHDQRQVNVGSDKTWHPPALQPTHQQVARRVLWRRARFPSLPVLIAKKQERSGCCGWPRRTFHCSLGTCPGRRASWRRRRMRVRKKKERREVKGRTRPSFTWSAVLDSWAPQESGLCGAGQQRNFTEPIARGSQGEMGQRVFCKRCHFGRRCHFKSNQSWG